MPKAYSLAGHASRILVRSPSASSRQPPPPGTSRAAQATSGRGLPASGAPNGSFILRPSSPAPRSSNPAAAAPRTRPTHGSPSAEAPRQPKPPAPSGSANSAGPAPGASASKIRLSRRFASPPALIPSISPTRLPAANLSRHHASMPATRSRDAAKHHVSSIASSLPKFSRAIREKTLLLPNLDPSSTTPGRRPSSTSARPARSRSPKRPRSWASSASSSTTDGSVSARMTTPGLVTGLSTRRSSRTALSPSSIVSTPSA